MLLDLRLHNRTDRASLVFAGQRSLVAQWYEPSSREKGTVREPLHLDRVEHMSTDAAFCSILPQQCEYVAATLRTVTRGRRGK
ncbi:hypothetical protein AOZ06_16450 [Kibdelosporangium phytohabitans]|uniref:Uncharacterized protein n=1 Tax=Kibdelosporangium phytohabitans TaxID=860235 RepID=A0A0N9HT86_9PSEU|nr:hypothetical protein AOZ06_16450 [Kibdelosporangium phytohabitans]